MNKKFFSALVFGALVTASTGTFVSCSDYDDDIKNLQEQIDKLAGKAELESQVSSLSSQISAAQAAADAAKSVADSKLDEAAVKAIAEAAAEGAAAAAQEGKDAAAVAQAAADAAKVAADAAQATADKGVSAAEAAQAAADAAAEAAKAVAGKLADYATKAELKAAQEVAAAAAAAAAEEGKAAAKIAADAAAAAQKTADEAVAAAKKAAEDAAAAKKAGIEAAAEAEKKAAEAQKTADAAVAAAKKAQETADKVAAAQAAADAAQKTADAAKTVADKAATDIIALDARVKSIETSLKALLTEDGLKNLMELVDKLNEDSADFLTIVSKRLTSLVFAPTTYINGIEAIEFSSMKYKDWGNKPELWLRDAPETKSGIEIVMTSQYVPAEVDKETYDKNPKAYVAVAETDGTHYYIKTPENIIGDNSATAEYYVSPSEGVTLESIENLSFLFNKATNTRAEGPVKIDSKSLKDGKLTLKLVKTGTASLGGATFTNGKEEFAVAALQATLAESVLTAAEKEADADVNVTSDWARLYETSARPYIANSLIRDNKGNINCSVNTLTSDSHFWAYTEVYNNTTLTAQDKKDGKQLYDILVENDNADIENNFIAKSAKYSEPLDLLSLVTVCDMKGSEWKNYAAYGLAFEFHIMKYLVANKGATQDNTDQAKFAVLDGNNLIATARDNTTQFNADAVGRTPVIQAVLKDTKNNTVVDVRYFKIKWVANDAITTTWAPTTLKPVAWSCTADYDEYVLEEYMNNLYSHIIEGGMTRDQFHGTYSKVYTAGTGDNAGSFFAYTYTDDLGKPTQKTYSFSDAQILEMLSKKDARLAKMVIGKVQDVNDANLGAQTHNFKITANYNDYRTNGSVNKVEQDYVIKGFFAFVSSDEMNQIVVPVTMNVKAGTLKYKYSYLASQWEGNIQKDNADKARPVNPTLHSDSKFGKKGTVKTTQMIGDITYGYIANGKTPANYTGLVSYYQFDDSKFKNDLGATSNVVFDATRLSMLPSLDDLTVKNPNTGVITQEFGWAATDKILYYAQKYLTGVNAGKVKPYNDVSAVIAAKLDDVAGESNKYIYLVDNTGNDTNGASNAQPTDAALRLVGKSVPVKVTAQNCDNKVFDQFLVRFITPLEWKPATDNIVLYDIKNNGEIKAVSAANQLTLKEAFGSRETLRLVPSTAIKWADGEYEEWHALAGNSKFDKEHYDTYVLNIEDKVPSVAATSELNNWYEVSPVGIDTKNIKINISKNGEVLPASETAQGYSKISDIMDGSGKQLYTIMLLQDESTAATNAADLKYVKYHNNSGQAITQPLIIKIPVTLDTKWQKGIANYITVTVRPNI